MSFRCPRRHSAIRPQLWESLNGWAKNELRSLNAQIEFTPCEAVRRRAGRLPSGESTPGEREKWARRCYKRLASGGATAGEDP